MSLVATFKSAVQSALTAAGDTKTTLTYSRVTGMSYDPATDTNTVTTTDVAVDAFVYALSDQEVDWFAGDLEMQKAIIAADDLGFVPETEDYITIGGVQWEVARIKRLPGDPMYIVFMRKT